MIMHWKRDERHGCFEDSPSMLVTARYFLSRWLQDKDSFCSLCAEAARKVIDQEERELLSARPGESIASAAKRAERVPPKPPQMEVVKD